MDDDRRSPERVAQRLHVALTLHEDGVAIMRQNLLRRFPSESDAEIDARLRTWLRHRPGADHDVADGLPVRWFRRRA